MAAANVQNADYIHCATSIRVARDYFEGRSNGGSEKPEFGMTSAGKGKEEGELGVEAVCGSATSEPKLEIDTPRSSAVSTNVVRAQ